MYARIILPLALPKIYTYAIPLPWQDMVRPGMRVEVVFGKSRKYAGIINVACNSLSGAAVQWPPVLCAGGGEPLVEPDGLVSVGAARGEQRCGQIDVVGACGAQVRPV